MYHSTMTCDGKPPETVLYYQSAAWASSAEQTDATSPVRIIQVALFENVGPSAVAFQLILGRQSRNQISDTMDDEPMDNPHFGVDIKRGDSPSWLGISTFQAGDGGQVSKTQFSHSKPNRAREAIATTGRPSMDAGMSAKVSHVRDMDEGGRWSANPIVPPHPEPTHAAMPGT